MVVLTLEIRQDGISSSLPAPLLAGTRLTRAVAAVKARISVSANARLGGLEAAFLFRSEAVSLWWSSILRVCSLLLFVSESSDAIAFVPVAAYFYTVSVRFSGVTLAFTSNERVYLGTGSESLKICMLECAYGR